LFASAEPPQPIAARPEAARTEMIAFLNIFSDLPKLNIAMPA
jgi:hypothetical protein